MNLERFFKITKSSKFQYLNRPKIYLISLFGCLNFKWYLILFGFFPQILNEVAFVKSLKQCVTHGKHYVSVIQNIHKYIIKVF